MNLDTNEQNQTVPTGQQAYSFDEITRKKAIKGLFWSIICACGSTVVLEALSQIQNYDFENREISLAVMVFIPAIVNAINEFRKGDKKI
jgi:hypothetical protein